MVGTTSLPRRWRGSTNGRPDHLASARQGYLHTRARPYRRRREARAPPPPSGLSSGMTCMTRCPIRRAPVMAVAVLIVAVRERLREQLHAAAQLRPHSRPRISTFPYRTRSRTPYAARNTLMCVRSPRLALAQERASRIEASLWLVQACGPNCNVIRRRHHDEESGTVFPCQHPQHQLHRCSRRNHQDPDAQWATVYSVQTTASPSSYHLQAHSCADYSQLYSVST